MSLNLVGWNVVLDSDNANELSSFYERLLGWTRLAGDDRPCGTSVLPIAASALDKGSLRSNSLNI